MYGKSPDEELKEFISLYGDILAFAVDKLKNVEIADAIAHILGEFMRGIDKARGGKKEQWSREEVFRLLEILKPSIIKRQK
jgi:hypothetical protein